MALGPRITCHLWSVPCSISSTGWKVLVVAWSSWTCNLLMGQNWLKNALVKFSVAEKWVLMVRRPYFSLLQVAEITSKGKCRLSVSGWFHGPPVTRTPRHTEPLLPRIPHIPCDVSILCSSCCAALHDWSSLISFAEQVCPHISGGYWNHRCPAHITSLKPLLPGQLLLWAKYDKLFAGSRWQTEQLKKVSSEFLLLPL